jgi:hypothetical protein
LIILALAAGVAAQSGRRITNPPPPPPPVVVPAEPTAQPDFTPVAPSETGALPEGLLNRELQSVDKGSFRLADFNGKVVVVNLWAMRAGCDKAKTVEL